MYLKVWDETRSMQKSSEDFSFFLLDHLICLIYIPLFKRRRSKRLFRDIPPIQSGRPCRTQHFVGRRWAKSSRSKSSTVVPSKTLGRCLQGPCEGPSRQRSGVFGDVETPPATWAGGAFAKPKAKPNVIRLVIFILRVTVTDSLGIHWSNLRRCERTSKHLLRMLLGVV